MRPAIVAVCKSGVLKFVRRNIVPNPFLVFLAPLVTLESDVNRSREGLLRSGDESALRVRLALVGVDVVEAGLALFTGKVSSSLSLLSRRIGDVERELTGLKERLAKSTKLLDKVRGLGPETGLRRRGDGSVPTGG